MKACRDWYVAFSPPGLVLFELALLLFGPPQQVGRFISRATKLQKQSKRGLQGNPQNRPRSQVQPNPFFRPGVMGQRYVHKRHLASIAGNGRSITYSDGSNLGFGYQSELKLGECSQATR
ncbi:hypothetical protein CMK12_02740 [Candidatus Poribacteria bacterium]|nr:hypothetical protein [Candidatus Poribacteria bacterium]